MKLEAGHYYRSQSGDVFGPMVWDGKVWRNGVSIINLNQYWNEDGRFGHVRDHLNLVEAVERGKI